MRNCRNAQVEVGEHVLIVGAGCIGQFAAQIAALRGARVTLCDIDPARLDLARRIGAAEEIVGLKGKFVHGATYNPMRIVELDM